MNSTRVHRQLFLPVGIFGLALLRLVFYWILSHGKVFQPLCALEVNLPPSVEWKQRYPVERLGIASNGIWRSFQVGGSSNAQSSLLDSLQRAIHNHRVSADTVNGIHIHFERDASYSSFVSVLDMISEQGLNRFAVDVADVWITRMAPRSQDGTTQGPSQVRGPCVDNGIPARENPLIMTVGQYSFLLDPTLRSTVVPLLLAWLLIGILNLSRIKTLHAALHGSAT